MKNQTMLRVLAASVCAAALAGQSAATPDEALAALVAGNERFAAGESRPRPRGEGVRRTLTTGQNPHAIVVACSDSRVAPEHLFNAGLGELYVVRIAGNVCDPESLASIEYAAAHLGASVCAVVAHTDCVTVQAALEQQPSTPAMGHLLGRIDPAIRRARREGLTGIGLQQRTETENAHQTVAECLRRSPILRELVRLKRFRLVAGHYDLDSGLVQWLPDRPTEERVARAEEPELAVQGMPPHLALSMLRAGHRRFLSNSETCADIGRQRRSQLLAGQRPIAVVLTCTESRVPPELVFDVGLGDVLVVRIAGPVINDEVLASIEYGVAQLGASLLVALGHQGCDVVTAAATEFENPHLSVSMRQLLNRLEPAVSQARHEGLSAERLVERATELNAVRSLLRARALSAVVREAERRGRLALVPVTYQLDTGDLHWLDLEASAEPPAAPGGAAHTSAHDRSDSPVYPSGVAFDPVPAHEPDHAEASTSGTPGDPTSRGLAVLLIAFMVATSGVATLLLWQRRAARLGCVDEDSVAAAPR